MRVFCRIASGGDPTPEKKLNQTGAARILAVRWVKELTEETRALWRGKTGLKGWASMQPEWVGFPPPAVNTLYVKVKEVFALFGKLIVAPEPAAKSKKRKKPRMTEEERGARKKEKVCFGSYTPGSFHC